MAPGYEKNALEILASKKNRIILQGKNINIGNKQFKTILHGVIEQDKDYKTVGPEDLKVVTRLSPDKNEISDLLFANKVVKHTKSNAIVLARGQQLLASGVGQTSRVDALKQAIAKAKLF